MKRAIACAMVFAFPLVCSTTVLAMPKPVEKVKRGVTTVISSPLELKKDVMSEVKKSHFKLFGLVGGVLKGTADMTKKTISGAIEIATFPMK